MVLLSHIFSVQCCVYARWITGFVMMDKMLTVVSYNVPTFVPDGDVSGSCVHTPCCCSEHTLHCNTICDGQNSLQLCRDLEGLTNYTSSLSSTENLFIKFSCIPYSLIHIAAEWQGLMPNHLSGFWGYVWMVPNLFGQDSKNQAMVTRSCPPYKHLKHQPAALKREELRGKLFKTAAPNDKDPDCLDSNNSNLPWSESPECY